MKLDLDNLSILKEFTKIIVTGPPRAGTTISSLIIAKELNYKFVDESYYIDESDKKTAQEFAFLIHHPRKMVIQMTAFTRDIHRVFFSKPTAIVLIIRNIDDIVNSMNNSVNFMHKPSNSNLVNGFDLNVQNIILKHFNAKEGDIVPEIIYKHFEENINDSNHYFTLKYDDLKNHRLFIKKEDRRKNFTHLKQVDFDPEYITKKGIMIL